MFAVHVCLIVLMTIDAGEEFEIGGDGVTISARVPPTGTVFVGCSDREERRVIEC
jgi:hypothetical protein